MTPSQQGRRNRRHGHEFERAVARYLSDATGLEVVTSRSVSGGFQAGSDLVTITNRGRDGQVDWEPTVHGWGIETKACQSHSPTPWLRQAKKDAPGNLYCVVAKRPRMATEDALVYMPAGAFVWWRQAVSVDVSGPVVVDLKGFGLMLGMEPWENVA
jgi:hypothetical protein